MKNNFFKCNNKYSKKRRKKPRSDIRCGVIPFSNKCEEILLVLNNYTLNKGIEKWSLPKGHRKVDEPYHICAKRELEEETGIIAEIRNTDIKTKAGNTWYYPCIIPKSTKVKPKDKVEISEARWFPIREIFKLNTNREIKQILQKILHIRRLAEISEIRTLSETIDIRQKKGYYVPPNIVKIAHSI